MRFHFRGVTFSGCRSAQSKNCAQWARGVALFPNTENGDGGPKLGEREPMVGFSLTPGSGFMRKKRPPAASQIPRLQCLYRGLLTDAGFLLTASTLR